MSGVDPSLIKTLPESVLKSTPAGPPPTGIEANFNDPPTLVPAMLGVGSAFLAVAVILYAMRMSTKIGIAKKLFWDDFCCTLGFLFALAYYVSVVIGCREGGIGRHTWDLHVWNLVNQGSLSESYITTVVNAPALGLIKLTLFIQYYLVFWPLRWVRITVVIGAVISGLFYLAVTISAFVLNSPRHGEELLDAVLSDRYLVFAKFSIPIGVIGLVIDLYLLILPIRAVMTLQLKKSKKLGMCLLFSTGIVASVSSIVGLYYRVRTQNTSGDETWIVSYLHIFTQIEMFAGISCACMPSAYKFLSTYKSQPFSFLSTSKFSKISLLRSHNNNNNNSNGDSGTRPETGNSSKRYADSERSAKSGGQDGPAWEMRTYKNSTPDSRSNLARSQDLEV